VKRAVLLTRLRRIAKENDVEMRLVRQGRHDVWECGGFRFPIPRHREINEYTARNIIKDLRKRLEASS
jgi:mRNA interferase HicA